MSEQYSHLTGGPAAPTKPEWQPQPEPPKRKKRGKVILSVIGVGLASFVAIGVATQNGGSSSKASAGGTNLAQCTTNCPTAAGDSSRANDQAPTQAPTPEPTTQAPTGVGDQYAPDSNAFAEPTVSQQNALESAQEYLDMGDGMSRTGLIKQLHSHYGEGYPQADAVWAVNHVHANWNHQAVLSARGYLDMEGFSREGLIEQLSSPYGEGFTLAQATHAADQVGL